MPKRQRKDYVIVAILLVITFLLLIGILMYRSFSNGIFMPTMPYEVSEDLESMPATGTIIETQYGNFPLTSEQVKMIEGLGVDVEALPEKITPELEECVRSRLGEERIQEIIESGGAGPLDAIKVVPCL